MLTNCHKSFFINLLGVGGEVKGVGVGLGVTVGVRVSVGGA